MLLTLAILTACPWFKDVPIVGFSALTEHGACADLIVPAADPAGGAMLGVEFTDAPLAAAEEAGPSTVERRYEISAGDARVRYEIGELVGNGVCTDLLQVGRPEPEAWAAVEGRLTLVLEVADPDPSVGEPRTLATLTLEGLVFESETGEDTLWLNAMVIEARVAGLPG